jgi:diadenosine tetraphosphate (Ap4A) HIT family hydrolase
MLLESTARYLYYNHYKDILPLRSGHVLVIPKIHCSRISDLPPEYAAATGITISRVGKALTQGMFARLRTSF